MFRRAPGTLYEIEIKGKNITMNLDLKQLILSQLLSLIYYVNSKKLTTPDACPIIRRFPLTAEHSPR